MFQLHRIFCATPWDLEGERGRFHNVVGRFNEAVAMQYGFLYVPVSLVNVGDKRPLQYAIDENIRDSRHYLLVWSEDWGPAQRNFQSDYRLALRCAADPDLPMQSVAVFAKTPASGAPLAPDSPQPDATFSTIDEFDQCLGSLLTSWMETLVLATR